MARRNVLVLAGAGTGKTGVMVERCLRRITDPADSGLDRILMVTFTEAAAAEMKHRILVRLGEMARTLGGEALDHVREQLALIDTAAIGTLHSIALDIIREHATRLELPSQLQVLHDADLIRLRNQALTETLNACYTDKRREAVAEWIRLTNRGLADQDLIPGNRSRNVRSLVLRLHEHLQSLDFPEEWIERQRERYSAGDPGIWLDWLREDWNRWFPRQWIRKMKRQQDHAPERKQEALQTCIDELRKLDPDLRLAGRQLASVQEQAGSGRLSTLTGLKRPLEEIEFFVALLRPSHPEEPVPPLEADWKLCSRWILSLCELARDFQRRFAALKLQHGGLDFSDIEQFTLRLLYPGGEAKEPGAIARTLQQRFIHVFVDEYQDINPAQDAILKALSRPEGNRFIVGDAKQSIYGFRSARPEILGNYRKHWRNSTIHLQHNFRSHAAPIDFFNRFFSSLDRKLPGFEYGPDAFLIPREPAESSGESRVAFHLAISEEGRQKDRQESEVHVLARHIRDRVAEGRLPLPDPETGRTRQASWQDFAILLRSPRNSASLFSRIFSRYRIPLQAERDSLFDLPVIRDLMALLHTMDNPLVDIHLLATLHSPLFGFTPDELALVRLSDRHRFLWHPIRQFAKGPEAESSEALRKFAAEHPARFRSLFSSARDKCREVLEKHARWQKDRQTAPPSECLERFLGNLEGASVPDRNTDAQVRQFFRLLEQFEKEQTPDLSQLVHWLDQQQGAADPIQPAGQNTGDAVRLLSIHSSKGLEFPIVVLAGIDRKFNLSDLHHPLILDDELGLCPKLVIPGTSGAYPSLPHALARERQLRSLLAEEARLLYVAMTRAREHLVLSGSVEKLKPEDKPDDAGQARSFLDWILPWMRERIGLDKSDRGESAGIRWTIHRNPAPAPESTDDARLPPTPPLEPEWIYPHRTATTLRRKASASTLREHDAPPGTRHPEPPDPSVDPIRKGLDYHAVLQFLDPDQAATEEIARKAITELAREGRIPEDALDRIDPPAIVRFWNSAIGRELQGQQEHMKRELPFLAAFTCGELLRLGLEVPKDPAARDEPILMSGIIDLAIIRRSDIWILDYKTDRLATGKDIASRTLHHSPQVNLYRAALERIHLRPVTRAWIHYLVPGRTVEVPTAPRSPADHRPIPPD